MLNKDATVWKFSIKVWWYIYFVLQALLIGIMIGTLAVPRWVHTSSNFMVLKGWCNTTTTSYFDGFYGNNFQGSISSCQKGGCLDYSSEAKDWCDNYDNLNQGKGYSACSLNELSSMCKLFNGLFRAEGFYIAFEIIAMCGIITWWFVMFMQIYEMLLLCLFLVYFYFSVSLFCDIWLNRNIRGYLWWLLW